jgi:predicted alpha/beta-hydrolase family hydrolase
MKKILITLSILILYSCSQNSNEDTFGALENGHAPQTLEELWKDFQPRKEALDIEIIKEWEEDGVVLKVLRYRIGIFKGHKAMMAAIYGYPKSAKNLPGLVQIHGGGQYADYRAVLTNAKRGYATISISWAGRINAPDYKVNPEIVKLFWGNKIEEADYKVTTDWGALDGYHAPCRNPENNFAAVVPQSWTLDSIESPRNNSWFLCAVGARRALTFLEQQAEVDTDKLGVYGHSMGGKLTVLTASDPRVKAAAPSCGGISDNENKNPLYLNTIADNVYLNEITCPTIFLSPSNDFHGHLRDVPKAVSLIKTDDWRVVSAAHHNHQDNGEAEVTGLLWFDHYLKGTFRYPKTPTTELKLKTTSGIPSFTVTPDASKPILEVDIYYTQQGENVGDISDRENRINRFWHHGKAIKKGNAWIADLPLASTEKPLWVYANVRYPLDEPVIGAGYYYRIYTTATFNLSSLVQVTTSEQLKTAGVKPTMKPSRIIETFEAGWEKDWFVYKPDKWEIKTHKLNCDIWKAPENAKLAFGIRCEQNNILVIDIDKFAKEVELKGGMQWHQIILNPEDLKNVAGENLADWSKMLELSFSANASYKTTADGQGENIALGAEWKGEKPEFRNLQWINM